MAGSEPTKKPCRADFSPLIHEHLKYLSNTLYNHEKFSQILHTIIKYDCN